MQGGSKRRLQAYAVLLDEAAGDAISTTTCMSGLETVLAQAAGLARDSQSVEQVAIAALMEADPSGLAAAACKHLLSKRARVS